MLKSSNTIVIVGSSNTDLVVRVDHFPKAGETIIGTDFMTAQGGKGANQAVAVARLGGLPASAVTVLAKPLSLHCAKRVLFFAMSSSPPA